MAVFKPYNKFSFLHTPDVTFNVPPPNWTLTWASVTPSRLTWCVSRCTGPALMLLATRREAFPGGAQRQQQPLTLNAVVASMTTHTIFFIDSPCAL